LLHRPTFDELVNTGVHLYDPSFASVLLLVCANAARFVDDVRVRLPGAPHRSAGWMWYTQVEITRPDLLTVPTLFRVQTYILAAMFLAAIYNFRGLWMLMGTVFRLMIELGVHRRNVYSDSPSVADEQWKRCWWSVDMADWLS
jgi:hypothetical protein